MDALGGKTCLQSVADEKDAIVTRYAKFLLNQGQVWRSVIENRRRIPTVRAESESSCFQRAERLLQSLLESAPDGHGLTNALHLCGQRRIGLGELFESKSRNLDHAVVNGGFKARRGFAGDVVLELIERVADGEFCGDFGDRKTGSLGGERRAARDPRVHLDDHHPAGLGMHRRTEY